jgi:hypothetical protein
MLIATANGPASKYEVSSISLCGLCASCAYCHDAAEPVAVSQTVMRDLQQLTQGFSSCDSSLLSLMDAHHCVTVVSKAKIAPLSSESFTLTVGGTTFNNSNLLPFLNNAFEVPTAQVCSIISSACIRHAA